MTRQFVRTMTLILCLLVSMGALQATSLVGDPAFDPDNLSPEMRIWYDRLLASMAHSESTVDTRSGSGDLFLLGRYVNDYTTSLIWALRATGDLTFLDRAAELWENARLDLSDGWCNGTTDGYLNWLWLEDPSIASLYCKDVHEMDDSMTHGAVAMLAHALDQNRQFGNGYGAKADFWVDYLENHFLQKWYDRDGSALVSWQSGGLYKRLTHPRTNQLRIAYYLYKITGNTFYLDRAQEMVQELVVGLEVNPTVPTAYQWKHQISGNDEGYQRINYAHYYMNGILEMYFEQFDVYGDESEMQKYMSTFRDVALTKFGSPWNNMSYLVDGSGSTSMNLYGLTSFARWDTTGTLLQIADDVYSTSSNVALSAGVLLGLTDREVGSENVPPYAAYYDAESGTIQSSFQVALDPLASNGAYVTTPPGTPTLTTGTVEIAIPINVPSSGAYYLWARILGPASDQDASFVGVDGSFDRIFPSTLGVWEWVRVEVTHGSGDYAHLLSAGPHELAVGHGEAEAQVDVLLVTDDSQFVPTTSDLVLTLPGLGTWRWMNNNTWHKLYGQEATLMAVADLDNSGLEDLVVTIAGQGTWRWMNNSSWYKLDSDEATLVTAADLDGSGAEDLIVTFAGRGTWRWMNNSSWYKLDSDDATLVAVADLDNSGPQDLIVTFAGQGTWRWMNNSSWDKLYSATTSTLVAVGRPGQQRCGGSDCNPSRPRDLALDEQQ